MTTVPVNEDAANAVIPVNFAEDENRPVGLPVNFEQKINVSVNDALLTRVSEVAMGRLIVRIYAFILAFSLAENVQRFTSGQSWYPRLMDERTRRQVDSSRPVRVRKDNLQRFPLGVQEAE